MLADLMLKNKDVGESSAVECITKVIRTKDLLSVMVLSNVYNSSVYKHRTGMGTHSYLDFLSHSISVLKLTLGEWVIGTTMLAPMFRTVCGILIEHSGCDSLVLSTKVLGVVHGYTYT